MTMIDERGGPARSRVSRRSGRKADPNACADFTARSRELGATLRAHREAAGLAGQEVARRCGWVGSTVSRLETGGNTGWFSHSQVSLYAVACDIPVEDRDRLYELATPGTAGCWVRPHGDHPPDEVPSVMFQRQQAAMISSYDPAGIPALIQSSEYAKLDLRKRLRDGADVGELASWVDARMEQQHVLSPPADGVAGPQPCHEFYVHEDALLGLPGTRADRFGQLLYLSTMTGRYRARVRVVPTGHEPRLAGAGAFEVYRFARFPAVVGVPMETVTLLLEGSTHVDAYSAMLGRVDAAALSVKESANLLASLVGDHA